MLTSVRCPMWLDKRKALSLRCALIRCLRSDSAGAPPPAHPGFTSQAAHPSGSLKKWGDRPRPRLYSLQQASRSRAGSQRGGIRRAAPGRGSKVVGQTRGLTLATPPIRPEGQTEAQAGDGKAKTVATGGMRKMSNTNRREPEPLPESTHTKHEPKPR